MFAQGRLRRTPAWILLVAVTAVSAACGNDSGVGVTGVQASRNISFSTTIQPGGFAWRSFKLEKAGKVTVQYAAISPTADLVMRVSLGSFDGTTCTPTTTLDTPPKVTDPQITMDLAAGDYCVGIADVGNVVQISVFAILVVITLTS
jgi:hypothetical protein